MELLRKLESERGRTVYNSNKRASIEPRIRRGGGALVAAVGMLAALAATPGAAQADETGVMAVFHLLRGSAGHSAAITVNYQDPGTDEAAPEDDGSSYDGRGEYAAQSRGRFGARYGRRYVWPRGRRFEYPPSRRWHSRSRADSWGYRGRRYDYPWRRGGRVHMYR